MTPSEPSATSPSPAASPSASVAGAAVLFDFDGVLVDSEKLWHRAYLEVLSEFGVTVSAEDYCAYMGELVGVEPVFEYTPEAHTPLWPDVRYMHEVLGHTRTPWRDGFRRMVEARHPERVSRR